MTDTKGFLLLPKRWVVERSFAWFGRNRRLSKDHQATIASIKLLIRPIARA